MKRRDYTRLVLASLCCLQLTGCYAVRWMGRVMSATGDAMVNATDHAQQERKQERAGNRAERSAVLAEKERKLRLKQANQASPQSESDEN